ncbi:MAG: Minf_1886 family protein [Verrucomicrobiota bacterium]|jgi:uncharacterized repeat protein (TIGR04138 family)|nr:hypothetical protein [Verrucomicrobiaceae bacterium]MEC9042883.1 Minf_1886 family protein [Verrucomicrobiota bacterium]MEC9111605.1 Minf_1886 family protein [Verrucomicrobiota bacterium]MED5259622.1 Minf_1886 family protein [Verrucomicrobiota bacterium]MED5457387.1 Minf_1886 family protein [Verrucomicrobiota bacterium]|tara:strand:- start:720 stop:1127 length:408 start_codon:yes stop_codon:yes gene_type:complete
MQKTDFHDAVEEVLKSNSDYSADSYYFLQEVLLQAVEKQRKMSGGENKHVSGLELLDAFRERMLKQFGPMSMTLLDEWGIYRTQDVGKMVFNLIEVGAFGKSKHDQQEDFEEVYDFHEAFVSPFLPRRKRVSKEG